MERLYTLHRRLHVASFILGSLENGEWACGRAAFKVRNFESERLRGDLLEIYCNNAPVCMYVCGGRKHKEIVYSHGYMQTVDTMTWLRNKQERAENGGVEEE